MPAGNDTVAHDTFRQTVEGQYGPYQNAEELVRAHQGAADAGLRRASISKVDQEATDELTKGDLDKVKSKFKDAPADSELVSVAVRGNALIGVFDTPFGHVKRVTGANAKFEAKLDPAEKAARASAQAEAQIAQETARLRAETEEKLAEVRAEEEERLAAEIEKIRAAAQKDVDKASDAAQKGESGTKAS